MDNFNIDYKIILLFISIAFNVYFYIQNRRFIIDKSIDETLLKIQDLSFNNPFLEDKKFISGWNDFKIEYHNNQDYDDSEKTKKYLQYEQYCEMLFNLVSHTYHHKKTEDKMLAIIEFKSWVRTHRDWWTNPLETHSNHDTYDKKVTKIIDDWIK